VAKADKIQKARISHNMLVCQAATFSPICIHMTLKDCAAIDEQILKAYQFWLKHMTSDTKHGIFLSENRGGVGIKCFTREYARHYSLYVRLPILYI
jgi:hypothetical protein